MYLLVILERIKESFQWWENDYHKCLISNEGCKNLEINQSIVYREVYVTLWLRFGLNTILLSGLVAF